MMVAQTLVSEIGLDMSRRKTEAHFASYKTIEENGSFPLIILL